MATVAALNTIQSTLALAQRRVQDGQSQVQQDSNRLAQSRLQLDRDQSQLNSAQRESRVARQDSVPAPATTRLDSALQLAGSQAPARATLQAAAGTERPQLNTLGQTIGARINVVA